MVVACGDVEEDPALNDGPAIEDDADGMGDMEE